MLALIFILFVVAIFSGTPIVFAIGTVSAAFLYLMDVPMNTIAIRMMAGLDSFPLMAIPFFVLAGQLMDLSLIHIYLRVVVICGGNHRLLGRMKGYFRYKDNVRIEGFVSNMEDYYAAADAAVMKPGGLSASEALCAGLPMLLIDPVPGQEELNMAYLTANGAAWSLPRPSRAAESVDALFSGESAQKMREAAKQLARPEAADEIIAKIAGEE